MHLREALEQIAEIRQRMAETEMFRGYRAIPAALSGMFAIIAGALQPWVVPDPSAELLTYSFYWIAVAAVSVTVMLLTIGVRDWLAGSSRSRKLTWLALLQFAPSVTAGCILTALIVREVPEAGWLLPGMWQLFFAQGVFASCRFLPRAALGVAAFYLVSGVVVLLLARDAGAFAPLAMGLPFGIGQFLSAAVLYWTLERHEQSQTQREEA